MHKTQNCFIFTSCFFLPVLHYQGGELIGGDVENQIPLNELGGDGGVDTSGGHFSGGGGTGYAYTTSCLVKGN